MPLSTSRVVVAIVVVLIVLLLVFFGADFFVGHESDIASPVTHAEKPDYKTLPLTELTQKATAGDAEAQNNLASRYYKGEGVPQDFRQAVNWVSKAAKQGHVDAQFNLGAMYDSGHGVSQNFQQAVDWFSKAAEQGHANAQFHLGGRYYEGKGVPQDYRQASDWWRKAAEQGHADAQFNLGLMYAKGEGVALDIVLAYALLNLAAAEGNKEASENRDLAAKEMTPGQIQVGQTILSQWQSGQPLPITSKNDMEKQEKIERAKNCPNNDKWELTLSPSKGTCLYLSEKNLHLTCYGGKKYAMVQDYTLNIGFEGCWEKSSDGKAHVTWVKAFDFFGNVRQIEKEISAEFDIDEINAIPPPQPNPSSPAKPHADISALIKEVEGLNRRCRDGSGDDSETWKACEKRDAAYEKIRKAGWCWGSRKADAVGAELDWLLCSEDAYGQTAHANANHQEQDLVFYRNPVYATIESEMKQCELLQYGVPAGLWGNREEVEEIKVVSPDGRMLTITGTHHDRTQTVYRFFLQRKDCLAFTHAK